MGGNGYTSIELTPLWSKPRGSAVTHAWRFLTAAHQSVQGVFDGLALVRSAKQQASGRDARGRLGRDETDLLRAAIVFTSSGLDASCKRLLRDTVPLLIEGNADAARKFNDYVKLELAEGPSAPLADAILSPTPREEMIRLYVAARTKASFQGSGDLKSRLRDTLGITNAQISHTRLKQLDDFFKARNAIVHDLDYEDPSSSRGTARNTRDLAGVRQQCDDALALVSEVISQTAANVRVLP
ncbi:hypothetical protein M8I34_32420 [Streptomyces sp. MCA2]|uniref:hypothetical protein n=1 Tax=Streptomyces sp. MCA2 TaxID=2944805 RepID=UPI002021319B|nr:hypothetical protein [Streptomyces sp. MCA2]MCL7496075.1 hypothetical protein [Streptomyces sp. MCA2]